MKFLNNLRFVFLPALSILFILITVPFVVFPWFREIKEIQKDTQFIKEEIENKLEPKLETLETQDPEMLKTDILKLESILPSEEDASSILGSFRQIAVLSGTEVRGIQYKGDEKALEQKEDLKTLSFSVSLDSSYANFIAIFKNIEKAKPFFDVEQFQISRVKEGLRGAFEISSYYKPLPLSLGEVTSPISSLTLEEEETLLKAGEFINYSITPVGEVDLGKTNLFE